jgi:hypothetical protein
MSLKRAISIDQIYKMNFKEIKLEGLWKDSIGIPEATGIWIIWGKSGNGKTSFSMQLARELCKFKKVAYNTLEEGARKSFRQALQRNQMHLVKKRFVILSESVEDLKIRMAKPKSPDFYFFDSYQYAAMSKPEYKAFKAYVIKHKKLVIFTSHAEGREPEGRAAKHVRYDADVKIHIEGFRASILSRFGGGELYTIWNEGAAEYWNEIK